MFLSYINILSSDKPKPISKSKTTFGEITNFSNSLRHECWKIEYFGTSRKLVHFRLFSTGRQRYLSVAKSAKLVCEDAKSLIFLIVVSVSKSVEFQSTIAKASPDGQLIDSILFNDIPVRPVNLMWLWPVNTMLVISEGSSTSGINFVPIIYFIPLDLLLKCVTPRLLG